MNGPNKLGFLPGKPLYHGNTMTKGKSPASFSHQVAEWFPDMFCNFYLVKNHKIAKNSTNTKLEKK